MNIHDKIKKIEEHELSQDPDNQAVLAEWKSKLNLIQELNDYNQLNETKRIKDWLEGRISDLNGFFEGLTIIDDKDAINAKLALRTAYKSLLDQFYTDHAVQDIYNSVETEINQEIIKLQL